MAIYEQYLGPVIAGGNRRTGGISVDIQKSFYDKLGVLAVQLYNFNLVKDVVAVLFSLLLFPTS